jgi:hypothetical protein
MIPSTTPRTRQRCGLVGALLLAAAPALAQPPPAGLTDTSTSPHVVVRSVGLTEVKWTTGFWAARFEVCRTTMIPTMGKIMEERSQSVPAQLSYSSRARIRQAPRPALERR